MKDDAATLAIETMNKIKKMRKSEKPLLFGEDIKMKRPNNPSDNLWENMLQSRCRLLSKMISAGFLFFVGFIVFAIVVYNLKNK